MSPHSSEFHELDAPLDPVLKLVQSAGIEALDAFWKSPLDVESGCERFYLFYAAKHLAAVCTKPS